MDTPFSPHDPFNFEAGAFQNFITQMVSMASVNPNPPPVTNAELKQRARMGDRT